MIPPSQQLPCKVESVFCEDICLLSNYGYTTADPLLVYRSRDDLESLKRILSEFQLASGKFKAFQSIQNSKADTCAICGFNLI